MPSLFTTHVLPLLRPRRASLSLSLSHSHSTPLASPVRATHTRASSSAVAPLAGARQRRKPSPCASPAPSEKSRGRVSWRKLGHRRTREKEEHWADLYRDVEAYLGRMTATASLPHLETSPRRSQLRPKTSRTDKRRGMRFDAADSEPEPHASEELADEKWYMDGTLPPTPSTPCITPALLAGSHSSASNFLSGSERWALRKLGDDAWLLGVPPHFPVEGGPMSRSQSMVLYEFQR
ncbi:hypothetical protein CALCODRAFT_481474 [Calocera cornea HHB12733]|uniref:Uncharacterized protein n=1 Tax=Calocera cornea HHB12733 TaxID=1353952 RepID=A0A165HPX9_9BASI|nr:hypothetical protein CALCODRAFT_481474 [Calocera cornea HHB12733]